MGSSEKRSAALRPLPRSQRRCRDAAREVEIDLSGNTRRLQKIADALQTQDVAFVRVRATTVVPWTTHKTHEAQHRAFQVKVAVNETGAG